MTTRPFSGKSFPFPAFFYKFSMFKKVYAEEDLPARLAIQIAKLREEKGLTQRDLAKKLHISQQALSQLEDPSSARYTLRTLQKLAAALNRHLVVELR